MGKKKLNTEVQTHALCRGAVQVVFRPSGRCRHITFRPAADRMPRHPGRAQTREVPNLMDDEIIALLLNDYYLDS